jgi:hypothetical protein
MNQPIYLLRHECAVVVDLPLATDAPLPATLRVHAACHEDFNRSGVFGRAEVLVAGEVVAELGIHDATGWERDRMHYIVASLDADGFPVDDGTDCELMLGDGHFRVSAQTACRLIAGGTMRIPYSVATGTFGILPGIG